VPVKAGAVPARVFCYPTASNQLSTMRADELCSLRQHANEVQWEEVRLVYDLLEPQQLILVIIEALGLSQTSPLQSRGTGCRSRGQLQLTGQIFERGEVLGPTHLILNPTAEQIRAAPESTGERGTFSERGSMLR